MLIKYGSIGKTPIMFYKKNHEVEHLTSYPDVNAKNPLIHVSLVEKKWKFFN